MFAKNTMRIKTIYYFLIVFMLLFLLPVGVFAEQIEGKEKTVVFSIEKNAYQTGDKEVKTDVAPYIKDGRTMVPVAFVAPALGTEPAQWFPNDRMVLVKKGETRIYIKIDSKELILNDQKMIMDVAAEIKDVGNGGGRTMLPISFIAKALDVGYEWKADTRSVHFYGYNKIYNQAGSFGPDMGSEVIEGSITIKADGVKLSNMTVKGNLVIAEEVGKGTVTLENINVQGETFIRGGGKDSIHIIGGMYNNITIQNVDGQVRVTSTGVDNLPVVIAEGAKGDEIILEGNFGSVKVEAEGAKISTQGQTVIAQLEVAKAAKETVINLNSTTSVTKVVLGAKTEVKGTGIIKEAEVNADGINFEKAPEKQTVAVNVATQPTTSTTTNIGGGGGGGGSSSPTVENVSAVTIATTPVDVSDLAHDAGTVMVTLSTSTSGADIYYTTDGTTPTNASTQYTVPFTVSNSGGIAGGTVTVKAVGTKSGMNNSAVAQKAVVYNAATTATVTDSAEFVAALENNNIGTITLGGDITGDVTATRAGSKNFTINFGSYVLTGNLNVTANSVTSIAFNGSAAPAINGNLTVSAASATITNGINVGGTITVSDVGDHSWVEEADGNTITLTDSNGATIVIHGNPEDITIQNGANGINITASSPVTITVNSGATVNSITTDASAAGTSITNNGTVSNVTANADIAIENNSGDINVDGGGTVGVSGASAGNVAGTATVVAGISSDLGVDQAGIRIGAIETANITVANLVGGETFAVTSANPEIVSVDDPTNLAITAEARGRTSITVKVYDGPTLIKQGTIFITVLPQTISAASATMATPAAGAIPQTAAQVEAATGNADYTVTSVTWNEALTAASKFKAGQTYTATVVLTSKNNKAFQQGALTPTVTGSASVGTTTTQGTGVGNRVTFTVSFPVTDPLTVTSIAVTTQPTKTSYREVTDNVLVLNDMVVTAINNDGTTTVVPFLDGTAVGYTADPENGAPLTNAAHNNQPVTITHTSSGQTATTDDLTVGLASTDATLSDLTVDGTTVTGFNPATENYTVTLVYGTFVTPTVVAIENDGNANAVVTPATNVTSGISSVARTTTVVVTAENGTTTKTYTILFNVAQNDDADLSSLTVSEGTLDPVFGAATTSYTVAVAHDVATINITAAHAEDASMQINGSAHGSGIAKEITLQPAGQATTITIVVTAANGDTKTYTVTVNRAAAPLSDDSTLSALEVGGTPVTGFDAGTLTYSVELPHGTNSGDAAAIVTATANDTDANVNITQASALPGAAVVVVTAEDGIAQKTYTINLTVVVEYTLDLETSLVAGGSVTDNTNSSPYEAGATVNVTAAVNAGYEFVNWTAGGVVQSTNATFDYTMPAADTTLVANFQPLEPTTLNISTLPGSIIVNIDSLEDNNGDSITFAQGQSIYGLELAASTVKLFDGENTVTLSIDSQAFTINTSSNPETITIDTSHADFNTFDPANFAGTEYVEVMLNGTFAGNSWSISDRVTGMNNIAVAIAKVVIESAAVQGAFSNIALGNNLITQAQGIVDTEVGGVIVSITSTSNEAVIATNGVAGSGGNSNIVFKLSKGVESASTASITVTAAAPPSSDTAVSSIGTHYTVTVHEASMIPNDNPIAANSTLITTSTTVEGFLGNLNFPTGAYKKIANASTIDGEFGTWDFATIVGKAAIDNLERDDLLLVLAEDGTLRGYYINVTEAAPDLSNFAVALVDGGDKTTGFPFGISITNAVGADGNTLSGEINITVTSDQVDGVVYNSAVDFVAGGRAFPITLVAIANHTLTVEVAGVTGSKQLTVNVVATQASISPNTASFSNAAGSATITITELLDAEGYNALGGFEADGPDDPHFTYTLTNGVISVAVTKAFDSTALVITNPADATSTGPYTLTITRLDGQSWTIAVTVN
ncbi:MAG: hypothetical protein JM58_19375 [Peptococcaceae bacterium BICA1-8]|nr:MAG: hypothetical protein JM58_19375 [Peptococcaceae bacterium BICA1-8]